MTKSTTTGFSGNRELKTRVKTARGRKPSSTRWLQRQLNDPYVALANKEGYRSRAAYKLIELDDKFFNAYKTRVKALDNALPDDKLIELIIEALGS